MGQKGRMNNNYNNYDNMNYQDGGLHNNQNQFGYYDDVGKGG